MRTRRRHEEGAATAEFALATLMLVPTVLYAMYVGEAFIAGIKAQEAEISATWEMTAYRLHNYDGGGYETLYTQAAHVAQARVSRDLRDFDSYDTSDPEGRINAASEYELNYLRCAMREGSEAGIDVRPGGCPENCPGLGDAFLHADGYVGCQAQVEFRNRLLPRRLHQEFDRGVELVPDSIAKLTLCGNGSTVQGCKGTKAPGMLVLTDDWGLEDPSANPVGTQNNRKYYNVGESIYLVHGRAYAGAAAIMASFTPLVGALDQAQTSTFKMGYMERVSKKQTISPTFGGPTSAHMSPFHEEANDYTDHIAGVSSLIYGERRTSNYLGKKDARWNGQ